MSSDTYRTHLLERQKYDQSRGGELNQTEGGEKSANDTKPLDYSFTVLQFYEAKAHDFDRVDEAVQLI